MNKTTLGKAGEAIQDGRFARAFAKIFGAITISFYLLVFATLTVTR